MARTLVYVLVCMGGWWEGQGALCSTARHTLSGTVQDKSQHKKQPGGETQQQQ